MPARPRLAAYPALPRRTEGGPVSAAPALKCALPVQVQYPAARTASRAAGGGPVSATPARSVTVVFAFVVTPVLLESAECEL